MVDLWLRLRPVEDGQYYATIREATDLEILVWIPMIWANIAYSAPILVLDVYEHAYFLQYADNKSEYINRSMDNINWYVVNQRMGIY